MFPSLEHGQALFAVRFWPYALIGIYGPRRQSGDGVPLPTSICRLIGCRQTDTSIVVVTIIIGGSGSGHGWINSMLSVICSNVRCRFVSFHSTVGLILWFFPFTFSLSLATSPCSLVVHFIIRPLRLHLSFQVLFPCPYFFSSVSSSLLFLCTFLSSCAEESLVTKPSSRKCYSTQ